MDRAEAGEGVGEWREVVEEVEGEAADSGVVARLDGVDGARLAGRTACCVRG